MDLPRSSSHRVGADSENFLIPARARFLDTRPQSGHNRVMPADDTDRRCPICRDGVPFDVICDLKATWITAAAAAPLPGYVCVVSKRHVVEPFQLQPADSAAFWADGMHVAQALSAELRPARINYEIHGNTIPHLHLHIYPRYRGDPFEGRPIDGAARSFHRSAAEIERLQVAIGNHGRRERRYAAPQPFASS
jgi:diadenosine tetraphosphate (Ap4A) HIT family hydrolase